MARYYIANHDERKSLSVCDNFKDGKTDYSKTIVSVLDSNYSLAEKIVNLLNKKS